MDPLSYFIVDFRFLFVFMICDVCIIGAGAAGLMAAVFAGRAGADVVVVERNTTAGRKLLRTGRGRCNLTHEATIEDFVRACEPCGRFLKHSLYTLSPHETRRFFHQHGMPTKVEGAGCVFPASDRATDVKNVLLEQAKGAGVRFVYGRRAFFRIGRRDCRFLVKAGDEVIEADRLIVATGGVSWPGTGSSGDGYSIAASFGHSIIEPKPILVPLVTREKWCGELAGLGIGEVFIKAEVLGSKLCSATGAMMFTHDGIGGPAVFDLSRQLGERITFHSAIEVRVDLFEGLSRHSLEQKIIGLCNEYPKRSVPGVLGDLLPRALADQLCRMAACAATRCCELPKAKREKLLEFLKALPLEIKGTRPIKEATATRGGVCRDEIDPMTMQSKLVPGLFFAGEVLDVDGPCGGYNLQIAWSTGALAGNSAATQN